MCKKAQPKGHCCSQQRRRKLLRSTGEHAATVENDTVYTKKTRGGVVENRIVHPGKDNLEDYLATRAAQSKA